MARFLARNGGFWLIRLVWISDALKCPGTAVFSGPMLWKSRALNIRFVELRLAFAVFFAATFLSFELYQQICACWNRNEPSNPLGLQPWVEAHWKLSERRKSNDF